MIVQNSSGFFYFCGLVEGNTPYKTHRVFFIFCRFANILQGFFLLKDFPYTNCTLNRSFRYYKRLATRESLA
jgi:hypothetical protein